MSDSKFSIQSAIRNGYLFVGREWPQLARLSLLPFAVTLIMEVMLLYQKPDKISFLNDFLCAVPHLVLFAWLMFVEARLILLGERPGHLPQDPAWLEERKRGLSACVIIWVLFIMAVDAFLYYVFWSADEANPLRDNPLIKFLTLFLVGGAIWGVRFWVAHLLAAVGYPIRRYIFRVNGIAISLRLTGLYILTCLPVLFVQQALTSMILPEDKQGSILFDMKMLYDLPQQTAIAFLAVLAFTSLLACVLSTATFCYALKEMLGRPQQEKPA